MPANTVTAYHSANGFSKINALHQYDYGQTLRFEGFNLPDAYEVHFSNDQHSGKSTTAIGNKDGVLIPDIYLTTGRDVWAWLFLHAGEDDGETVYTIQIPVIRRASISNAAPTPVQHDVITQAIAALNTAVEKAEEAQHAAEEAAEDAKHHGGTSSYDSLENKPTLGGVEVSGDKTLEDYGIQPLITPLSEEEMEEILSDESGDWFPGDPQAFTEEELEEIIEDITSNP